MDAVSKTKSLSLAYKPTVINTFLCQPLSFNAPLLIFISLESALMMELSISQECRYTPFIISINFKLILSNIFVLQVLLKGVSP